MTLSAAATLVSLDDPAPRRLLVGAGVAALALGALVLGASAYIGHMITTPRRVTVIATETVTPSLEEVTFQTDDGVTLHGWYFACPGPRDAVIVCHGFGMSRNELLDLAQGLRARDHAVLLFDFRAHGMSGGARSTIGYQEAEDIGAAVRFLQARPELAGRQIGVAGISMGAAAAIMAGARYPTIAAVVADSGFATLHDIAANGLRLLYRVPPFPFAPLVVRFGEFFTRSHIRFNRPIDAVAAIAPRPVLIVHQAGDPLVPVRDARALYAAAGEPKELWIVPEQGHAATFLRDPAGYLDRLDRFFARWLQTS